MQTLAEFKRLAVVGAKFDRTFVGDPPRNSLPVATKIVNHVQSNAIAFRIDPDNESTEHGNRSWFYFPKKGEYKFEGGMLHLLDMQGITRMTLKHVE